MLSSDFHSPFIRLSLVSWATIVVIGRLQSIALSLTILYMQDILCATTSDLVSDTDDAIRAPDDPKYTLWNMPSRGSSERAGSVVTQLDMRLMNTRA